MLVVLGVPVRRGRWWCSGGRKEGVVDGQMRLNRGLGLLLDRWWWIV